MHRRAAEAGNPRRKKKKKKKDQAQREGIKGPRDHIALGSLCAQGSKNPAPQRSLSGIARMEIGARSGLHTQREKRGLITSASSPSVAYHGARASRAGRGSVGG